MQITMRARVQLLRSIVARSGQPQVEIARKAACDSFAAKPAIKDHQPKVRHEKNKEAGQSAAANEQIVAPFKSHSRQHGHAIASAAKNGGRSNGICLEADMGEKRSPQQGLHVHEEHTRPRMFGGVDLCGGLSGMQELRRQELLLNQEG